MKTDVLDRMNNLAYQMTELSKELRLDPSEDAQFCARLVSTGLATINMRIGENWGMKLMPVPLPGFSETGVQIDSEDQIKFDALSASQAPATPKAKKTNSSV